MTHLGFNADDIAKEVDQPIAKQGSVESEGDVRGNRGGKREADVFLNNKNVIAPKGRDDGSKEENEKLAGKRIKRALLVGNFSAAVKSCLQVDNMADALLLASCGGAELWASTQAEYFDRHGGSSGYLEIASAIVNSELRKFVEKSDLTTWKETLAVLRFVIVICMCDIIFAITTSATDLLSLLYITAHMQKVTSLLRCVNFLGNA